MAVAATLPSEFVVPRTITVWPVARSEVVPVAVFETVVELPRVTVSVLPSMVEIVIVLPLMD